MLSQKQRDAVVAPLCEAGLLLAAGVAALVTHQPLLFASLGPTAFELAEMPERKSAQPYNILLGHLLGVVSGFAALWMTRAWYAPPVMSGMTVPRIWASVVATVLTVVLTILLKARQPAALSTTLLVATGAMQRPIDGPIIMAGILLVDLLGEPLRRLRVRHREEERARGERLES